MIEFGTNGTPNFCNYHELYEEQNCKTEIVIFFRYHFDDTWKYENLWYEIWLGISATKFNLIYNSTDKLVVMVENIDNTFKSDTRNQASLSQKT